MKMFDNKRSNLLYLMWIIFGFIDGGIEMKTTQQIKQATFGAGCFWCVEAVFERLNGVVDVRVGYTGGMTENPTYDDICTKNTGHAEVIQIDYDSNIISYDQLVDLFWKAHDPTTLNRQGADIGNQYRSVIFYHNIEQMQISTKSKNKIDKSGVYLNSIVTEIMPLGKFYIAEDYHQNYYQFNPDAPYCQIVIKPKLKKLKQQFK